MAMQILFRSLGAAAAAYLVYISYEPHGLWWAALAGMALLWLSFDGTFAMGRPFSLPGKKGGLSLKAGAFIAFIHTLCLYQLMLPWIGELVGAMPYVALAIWLSIFSLVLGPGAVVLSRTRWGVMGFPFFFLLVELMRSSFPFGGFAWVRLGWGQIDGPLAGLARLGGPALVSWAAAALGAALAAVIVKRSTARFASLIALAAFLGTVSHVTAPGNGETGNDPSVVVAAIQGNVPRLGLDFEGQRRAVLGNHVQATHKVAQQGTAVDMVIWPENSSDVNPFEDAAAMALIRDAAVSVKAPILVGTLTEDAAGEHNTMQVFNADGQPGEFHYKKYLQPFGETMPMRSLLRRVTPLVDLAGDFKPGNGTGVVHMNGIALGVATCYEVSFDGAFRSAINNGAQILSTPTNNATFGFSDMTYQQLAMSRMRAIETDRAVVVAATSGVSAIVHPDGSVSQETNIFEQAYLIEQLPLRKTITPAVRFGTLIQALLVAIGGAWVACAALVQLRRRSTQPLHSKPEVNS